MEGLTKRQKQVLEFIRQFIEEHEFPPTIRDIAGRFKMSVRAAYDHVRAIEKKGYIKRDKKRNRAIELSKEKLKLVKDWESYIIEETRSKKLSFNEKITGKLVKNWDIDGVVLKIGININ